MSQPANFLTTGEYLHEVRNATDRNTLDFLVAILRDLHHGELPPHLDPDPTPFFRTERVDAENRYGRPIRHLEWFEDADVDLRFIFGGGLPGSNSPLDVEFDLVWLDLHVRTDRPIRVAPNAMRGLRAELVTTLYDARPTADRGVLEERCVMLVTVDGPAYTTPELTTLGPSKRTESADGEERSYAVNIVHFPFSDDADDRATPDDFTNRLNSHLAALAKGGEDWKESFDRSVHTLSQARNEFRRKLRRELRDTMAAFEKTRGPADDDQLHILRQAASLVAYRTMFLLEVERRGRLYRGPVTPAPLGDREVTRSMSDQLAYMTDGEIAEPGALLARLTHTVRAIRGDIADDAIAITGASIFENRPENFDESVGLWLDDLERLVDEGDDPALLAEWDRRIKSLGAVTLGHLDDEYRAEVNLIGSGAHRHRHRVLGNIYEQILTMTPKRADDGTTLKLVVSENGDDDDRSALGAHYTPIDLVEEVVRPTLGHLFRQYWDDADGDVDAYRRRIQEMTVVDPAMGSAHFLTVAALEIARELAWLDFFDEPRIETLDDWDEPLLHKNSIGRDDDNDSSTEHQFYNSDSHDDFVAAVRNHLPSAIRRSIYGVDVNPLACELGKLSLWLFEVGETDTDGPAGDYPELTYLNANIRCGDSVVGVFLDDVDETVENALRSKSSFDGRQQTMMGMMTQTDTVEDKLDRARLFRNALLEVPDNPRAYEKSMLDTAVRETLDLDGVDSGYELKHRIDLALRDHLADLAWLFDLTLAIRYIGYTSGSGKKRAARLYGTLFAEKPPSNSTSDIKPPIENALRTLFETPDTADALNHRQNLADWLDGQPDLDPFHWELEYPGIFQRGGFDAVVANPPFIGDRDLRGRLGSEDLVEFLANYFIPQQKKSDYSGFFFWRYTQILNEKASFGSLASNSLAQASNRKYVTKPITDPDTIGFEIYRAVPNRKWPGDANVHFAAIFAARSASQNRRIIRNIQESDSAQLYPAPLQHDRGISSYLDEYPDFNLNALLSGTAYPYAFTGIFLRGNFSIHRQHKETALEAIGSIPENERDALAAYLNSRAIQQHPRPTPIDVVIDFFEPLKSAGLEDSGPHQQREWLESNYPHLLDQLRSRSPHAPDEESVFEQRRSLRNSSDNDPHKEYWWLFGRVRREMRDHWQGIDRLTAFPAVIKIWTPFALPKHLEVKSDTLSTLRICPMHNLYIAPTLRSYHNAIIFSFFFEMVTRRQCSSLKSDLRFTPTNVFPYFPWPWKPEVDGHHLTIGEPPPAMRESLTEAAENLLDLRTDILENPTDHGLTRDLVGGPTDLYNLYDSDPNGENPRPGADAPAIEDLRRAHVDLLDAVLHAYGWDDIADDLDRQDWTFDRPWLDRTQRFVPPEPVRAELFRRIDELNTQRYNLERDLMIDIIAEHLPEDGLTKTAFTKTEPFTDMPIDKDQFEQFMEWEAETGTDARVRKNGSRWHSAN